MNSLKLSDLISVMLIISGLIISADGLFGAWAGRARHFLTEIMLLMSLLAYIKLRGLPLRALLRWNPIMKGSWLLIVILSLSSAVLLDEFDRIIKGLLSVPHEFTESIKDAYQADSLSGFIWLILGLGIAAPWVEESIFRGFFQRGLESMTSLQAAILIPAFLFAIIHLQPYWFIQLMAISLIAGYCASITDSIIPAVAVHSANNIWSLQLINDALPYFKSYYLWRGHVNLILIFLALFGFIYSLARLRIGWKSKLGHSDLYS